MSARQTPLALGGSAGHILLEVLCASGSGLLIVASLLSVLLLEVRVAHRELAALDARSSRRHALGSMAHAARGAGFDPTAFGGAVEPIAAAEPDRVIFQSDLHGPSGSGPPDGVVDSHSKETLGFRRTTSSRGVAMTVGGGSNPLLDGLRINSGDFVLRYLDDSGNPIAPATALEDDERRRVRRIEFEVAGRDDAGARNRARRTAALRNRPPVGTP